MHRPVCLLLLLACALPLPALELDRPMGPRTALAFLDRFGYGATPSSLAEAQASTPRQFIQTALSGPDRLPDEVRTTMAGELASTPTAESWRQYGTGGKRAPLPPGELNRILSSHAASAVRIRLLESANNANQGREVLLNFWLNHFSVYAHKGVNRLLVRDYADALRAALAEDSFLALLRASFRHAAMQHYLDNQASVGANSPAAERSRQRGRPLGLNENLARELLELHTLGVDGGYRQQDILELARIISGAAFLNREALDGQAPPPGLFHFYPDRHDTGRKTLLGQDYPAGAGEEEIERALAQLAAHPSTAAFIARKLARRFLADEPPAEVVDAMRQAFLKSGGRISETLWPMLASPAFDRALAERSKFKEALDYTLSAARLVCGDQPVGNAQALRQAAMHLQQAPFQRSTPEGYGSERADWLSPTGLSQRIRLAQELGRERLPLASAASDPSPARACPVDLARIEAHLPPLSPATRDALSGLNPAQRLSALLASPEFMHR